MVLNSKDTTENIFETTYGMIFILINVCVYATGVYIHRKIIGISKQDRDVTWKLDVTNSIVVLIHYVHYILILIITHIVHDLYMYTGKWLCYLFKIVTYYGGLYVGGHSLTIAMMKYILIVRWKGVRDFGKDKVISGFFWINMFHPMFFILLHVIIRPDFFWVWDGHPQIDRCLGDPKNILSLNSSMSQTKLHHLCIQLKTPSTKEYFDYTIFVFRTSICWLQFLFEYLTLFNVFEVIVYCRIFRFMHR